MSQEPDYRLSLDPADLQLDVVHGFLQRASWSPGIPRELVMLTTDDAHGVYRPLGFRDTARPEIYLEILRPGNYQL